MKPDQMPPCTQAEQAVGWALQALEPAEEAEFAAHVTECDRCREQVAQAQELLATLGGAESSVEPPVSLRSSLLALVADTPQLARTPPELPEPSRSENVPTGPRTAPIPAPLFSDAPDVPVPPARRRPSRSRPNLFDKPDSPEPAPSWPPRRRWVVVLAAAALAAIVGIGGLVIRSAQIEQQRDAATSQAQQLASALSDLEKPGARHAMLAAPGQPPVAALLLVDGQRKLITVGLAANSTAENIYVLWGTGDGAAPRPLGTFDIATADTGSHTVGPLGETDRFTGYAISLEPGRQAPATPSTVVASGQVQT